MFKSIKEAFSYLRQDYLPEDEWEDNMRPVHALHQLKGNSTYQDIAVYGVGPGIPIHTLPFVSEKLQEIILADFPEVNRKITEKFVQGFFDPLWLPYFNMWVNQPEEAMILLTKIKKLSQIKSIDLFEDPRNSEFFQQKPEATILPFVAESITDNEESFELLLRNVLALTKIDAYFICLLNSHSWGTPLSKKAYSSYPLTVKKLENHLKNVGFKHISIIETPSKNSENWNGYAVAKAQINN